MSDDTKRQLSVLMKSRRQTQPTKYVPDNSGRRPATRYEDRICPECNSVFNVRQSKGAKYCSRACSMKNAGGAREGSGRAKTGYYKGIYCGSSYELAWVIYRLDHHLPVTRFPTYILYGDNKKYFPDFVDGTIIFEMKGRATDDVALKTDAAEKAGYTVRVLYKSDLHDEFAWATANYSFTHIWELYDEYKPMYTYSCATCGVEFSRDVKSRSLLQCCSRKCALSNNRHHRKHIATN